MRDYLLLIFLGFLLPHTLMAGVVHPRFAWPGGNAPVCWGGVSDMHDIRNNSVDTSDLWDVSDDQVHVVTPEVRHHFRSLLEAQVTPEKTGVHLSGWESCGPLDIETVKIIFIRPHVSRQSKPVGGMASIGYRSKTTPEGGMQPERGPSQHFLIMDMADGMNEDLLQEVEWVFLHEFGHVLGLRHGHLQSPTTERRNEIIGRGALITSAYDPYSVMDYDFLTTVFGLPHSATLSAGDLHSLRCLYSYNRSQRRQLCHSRYRPWEDR